MYHLTPGWILYMRVCVYITDSTCRTAESVPDEEERGRATDTLPTPALSQPARTKLLGCNPPELVRSDLGFELRMFGHIN